MVQNVCADEGLADAPAALKSYLVVAASQFEAKPLPGLPLANAIFNSASRGLWGAYDACLASLVGLHGRWAVASIEDGETFLLELTTYLAGFQAEFRRVDNDFRAGGRKRVAATKLIDSLDLAAMREWLDAFASSEHSGWESWVLNAPEPPRRTGLSGLFGRATR